MNRIRTVAQSWIPIAALLGATLLVVAGLAIAAVNERAYWQRRTDSLAAQGEVLAATVQPALLFLDPAAARDAVLALQANPDVQVAGVYDAQGALVARFGRGGAVPPDRAPAVGQTFSQARITIAVPVRHEGSPIGEVYLRTGVEPLHALIGRHAGILLLMATSVVVVALLQGVQVALTRASREAEARACELARANQALQEQIQRREFAEEALRQSQKMETLGRLTGGIAHDFNNLLQGVQGALDIIARKPEDTRKVARWSAAGLEAAERGARLTAQLLAFSRSQRLELRPIDVADVTGRLGQLLPSSLGPGVHVVFDLEETSTTVVADPTQLELAVLNLCINARDAMPNGGEITIRSRKTRLENDPELAPGDYLLLSVTDTGVGMPADVQAHAFEPFFTTKGVGKGTGLGLAQVYGIAKQAGGTARIQSTPGEGATVTIYLPPAQDVRPASLSSDAGPKAAAQGGGALILVVDDDEGVRDYIVEILQGLGYATLAAEDGPAGLAVLDKEPVDLVVLDYAMPGMTGAEVAQEALKTHPDLPILFASGYAETEALEGVSDRPVRLLRKPFQADHLAEAVHDALTQAA